MEHIDRTDILTKVVLPRAEQTIGPQAESQPDTPRTSYPESSYPVNSRHIGNVVMSEGNKTSLGSGCTEPATTEDNT